MIASAVNDHSKIDAIIDVIDSESKNLAEAVAADIRRQNSVHKIILAGAVLSSSILILSNYSLSWMSSKRLTRSSRSSKQWQASKRGYVMEEDKRLLVWLRPGNNPEDGKALDIMERLPRRSRGILP